MYRAKETGKGRFEIFDPSMRDAVLKRHGLKEELQRGGRARRGGGRVPADRRARGRAASSAAEALVRWNHPGRGPPAAVGVRAARRGDRPDRRASASTCWSRPAAQARALAAARDRRRHCAVHVNLSAVELQDPDLAATRRRGARRRAGCRPDLLVLEITESLVQDADASATALAELRALGVRLALDDFGTGYSSLSYLRSLPLDILKIAKPFVEGIGPRPPGELVRAHDHRPRRARSSCTSSPRASRPPRSSRRCASSAASSARASSSAGPAPALEAVGLPRVAAA